MIDSTQLYSIADDLRLALDCSHPGAACAGVVLVEKKLRAVADEMLKDEMRRSIAFLAKREAMVFGPITDDDSEQPF